jgi:phage terminase large subunit
LEVQRIEIPYAPRKWAKRMHASFKRWFVLVLHRRAGKTTSELNHHQRYAMDDDLERARLNFLLPGDPRAVSGLMEKRRIYWHVMPTLTQAKMVAWDMLKDISRPIPGMHYNASDLEATYPNGNKLRLRGADDPDSLRGPGLRGLSLDEFSQIQARVFDEILSKALSDQLGYCIFSGTIQGKDQLYDMYEGAKNSPEWLALWQNIDESLSTESGPTISALLRAMEDDRKMVRDGVMTQAAFDQEWYLSADAAIKGAIYGPEMSEARRAGRITRVPYDPALPVDTDWDIGVGDNTSVWFSQSLKTGEVRLIDYYENSGVGIPHYAKMLQGQLEEVGDEKQKAAIRAANERRRRYVYGKHWGPHDVAVQEFGTGKTRIETAKDHGFKFEVTPRLTTAGAGEVEEGINAVRLLLPRCYFDEANTEDGRECLTHYRRDYNKRLDEFKPTPVHDWASHGADAFRGLAVRHQIPREAAAKRKQAPPPAPDWSW